MHVWLVRHAVAAERGAFEGPDADRPLTPKGRKQFRSFVRWLRKEIDPPPVIVTSPLVRAIETAEILRRAMGLKKKDIVQSDVLSPGGDPVALLELAARTSTEAVALVGHEPDLSQALSRFIGGGEFNFGKGFVAAVDFAGDLKPGRGCLSWMAGPRLKSWKDES